VSEQTWFIWLRVQLPNVLFFFWGGGGGGGGALAKKQKNRFFAVGGVFCGPTMFAGACATALCAGGLVLTIGTRPQVGPVHSLINIGSQCVSGRLLRIVSH
jgi:hypothetical protein